ncbi:PHP domain-containing protein [Candidatus Bipolaricaulota bacterium]|nr:PHP domain-containing protein [Candidatus Bipolaricaulota bacterium]
MNAGKKNSDFHVHSRYSSDGHLEPERIISLSEQNELETIAVTDHGTIRGGKETRKKAEELGSPLNVVVGAEINTDKGEVIGLGLEREIQSDELGRVVDEIKEQGGEVYIPHPFDRLRGSAIGLNALEIVERIDYVEAFNGRCLLSSFDRKAEGFADEYGIPKLSGSDAHFGFEVGNLEPGPGRFLTAALAHALTKITGLV